VETKDLNSIFRHNAILAIQLSMLKPEQLANTTVYLPEALPPKFLQYCQRVGLESKPALVVGALLNSDNPLTNQDTKVLGNYAPFGNSTWLTKEAYDFFEADKPIGNYMVAHELGHAANGFTRRKFLGRSAAVAGAGLAGAGAWSLTGAALDAKPMAKRELNIRDKATTAMQSFFGSMATKEALKRLLVAYEPSLRGDELSADDYAKKIVELHGVVFPQITNLIAEHKAKKSPIIQNLAKRFKDACEKQQITLSTEESNLYFALYIVDFFDKFRAPVTHKDLYSAYPDFVDRLKHQRTWIEQALEPNLKGRSIF
jgi:hypothetical protein